MDEIRVITEGLVNVQITSNCNSFTSEKRFAKDLTVSDLKGKLELITGASSLSMTISAFDKNDKKVCDLNDDAALFGSFPVDSGMRLHVEDKNVGDKEFENVEKFEMSKEEYSKRTNTVQSFLKSNKLGKYNEEEMAKIEAEKAKQEDEDGVAAGKMQLGDRCLIKVPGNMDRRGSVAFVGKVHFKPGWWVGVKFDEPLGKNNGTVDGKKYFECKDKYGGFVRVAHVEIGDFPEEDLGLSDEDEM